jgi:hypothetical protein
VLASYLQAQRQGPRGRPHSHARAHHRVPCAALPRSSAPARQQVCFKARAHQHHRRRVQVRQRHRGHPAFGPAPVMHGGQRQRVAPRLAGPAEEDVLHVQGELRPSRRTLSASEAEALHGERPGVPVRKPPAGGVRIHPVGGAAVLQGAEPHPGRRGDVFSVAGSSAAPPILGSSHGSHIPRLRGLPHRGWDPSIPLAHPVAVAI